MLTPEEKKEFICYINVTNGKPQQTINVTRLISLSNLNVTLINLINVTNSDHKTPTTENFFSLGGFFHF